MKKIDTGYDGGLPPERDDGGYVVFRLVQAGNFASSSFVAQLMKNGESCGLIYLQDEEEFHWLKDRVDGRFLRDDTYLKQEGKS